ncbi:MAG: 4'-phosphopantetheinyl transferase superfamily protein [Chloroflexota bacterium]
MISTIDWMVSKRRTDLLSEDFEIGDGFLSPNEKQKLSWLRFAKRRTEWLHGRWTAKQLLSASSPDWREVPFDEIEVANAAGGAPYYTSHEIELPICLSISHRERMAFCALSFSPGLKIGADVEKIESYPASFIETFFTQDEINSVKSCAPQQRDAWVVLVWSLKEAVLKALGEGLRLDTRHIKIQPVSGLDAEDSMWRSIEIKLDLPITGQWMAWWLRQDDYLLTLAAHWMEGDRQFDIQQQFCDAPPDWL